jgi:hypothetical protein
MEIAAPSDSAVLIGMARNDIKEKRILRGAQNDTNESGIFHPSWIPAGVYPVHRYGARMTRGNDFSGGKRLEKAIYRPLPPPG